MSKGRGAWTCRPFPGDAPVGGPVGTETQVLVAGKLYKRADGKFGFRVTASNGQVVATDGGQGYSGKGDARSTLEKLRPRTRFRLRRVVAAGTGEASPVDSPEREGRSRGFLCSPGPLLHRPQLVGEHSGRRREGGGELLPVPFEACHFILELSGQDAFRTE